LIDVMLTKSFLKTTTTLISESQLDESDDSMVGTRQTLIEDME